MASQHVLAKDLAHEQTKWEEQKKELKTTACNRSEYMQQELEKRWGNEVFYTCDHCLITAYDNDSGYITDECLIECSGGRMEHM